jgi:hypothetical protein
MFQKIARAVKTFSFMLLAWQGQFLQKRIIKRLGYDGKKSVKGCTIELKGEEIYSPEQLSKEVELILKHCKVNPIAVIEVLKSQDLNVYQIKNAEKILKRINEKIGFISERTGISAISLSFLTKKCFGLKTKPMIVIEDGEPDIYMLMNGLHKWCAYRNGLSGLDEKSQKLLRRFDKERDDKVIGKLSLKDIEKVRNAIARDVQAIDFVVKYSKEHAGAKKALDKIKNDGGANI